MTTSTFSAYLTERDPAGAIRSGIQQLPYERLPPGDVLIRAHYSSLNYKDALAATGHPGVARTLPHVPGIDVAGVIEELGGSGQNDFRVGDEVLVTGYELGAGRWGGWSEYVRVPTDWVIRRPASLSLRESMILGTAGFTAAQCVQALQHQGIAPRTGKVVVTGATGGVGSVAVMLLAKLGYQVTAVTGKAELAGRLRAWGATEVAGRDLVHDASGKPLLPGIWSGAIDTVGGDTLATVLRQTRDHGCVAACGLVGGTSLPLSVYPFILRGITLSGITSSGCLAGPRREIWRLLSDEWRLEQLDELVTEIPLSEVQSWVPRILAGQVVGRTVVRIP